MISGVLLVSVARMENRHRRKDWRESETMEDAARRLLQELDERVRRKASERLKGSEKFADRQQSPAEKWPEPSDKVGNIAPGSGQSAPLRGGNSGDLIANAVAGDEIGITDGRADLTTLDLVHGVNPESTARPSSGSALGTDRAATRSGRFG